MDAKTEIRNAKKTVALLPSIVDGMSTATSEIERNAWVVIYQQKMDYLMATLGRLEGVVDTVSTEPSVIEQLANQPIPTPEIPPEVTCEITNDDANFREEPQQEVQPTANVPLTPQMM